ncbi:hypothetical protein D3C75_717610 [compost metagenome]
MEAAGIGHGLGDARLDAVHRADRRGRFVDDQLGAVGMFEDAVDHGKHVLQVGAAIGLWRGADGNELQPGVVGRFAGVGGETQATAGQVLLQHRRKAGLEDRAVACIEAGDPLGVDIHAQHRVPHLGQAHCLGEADIAGTENRDLHLTAPWRES